MTTPHPHAELIHAFADGKTLQYKHAFSKDWTDYKVPDCPEFSRYNCTEGRVKPDEPKKGFASNLIGTDGRMVTSLRDSEDFRRLIAIEGYRHLPELDREVTLEEA